MEDQVKKIESILGEKFEDWTDETLTKMLKSEEAISAFTPELVVHLLLTRRNDKIADVLVPIKYGFDIRAIKAKIEEQLAALREKGLPMEEYKKNVTVLKKLDNPIFKVAVYLTEVASFGDDHDASKEESQIVQAISGVGKIMASIKVESSFQVLTELLDLLFPLRELYFQKYKVDLFKGNDQIKSVIDSVNEMAREIVEFSKSSSKAGEENKNK